MKIRKIGRKRPVLYRGRFNVPKEVISRLAVAKNHYVLAQIANFNGKVDQFYLTIDNILSAIIIAKEGTLTTTSHREKIDKFFKYFKRRAKIRRIDKSDFEEFYDLWQKSRYKLYFPESSKIQKMELFVSHLFSFAITEIARFYKSDENILAKKIDELIEIYQSGMIQEELEHFHEYSQMEAEHLGEICGGRLGMKLANPWNYVDISLLTDSKSVVDIVDYSEEIRDIIINFLKNWDKLISKVREQILKKITTRIAQAKMTKRGICKDAALRESLEAAAKHPEAWRFRLVLNFSFDSSEPKEIVSSFSRAMKAIRDMEKNPHKAIKNGWEIYKEYGTS